MPATPDGTPTGPDDINRRLDEIAAELAGQATFSEPAAAELASKPVLAAPGRGAGRPGPWTRRRNARTAARLRGPVPELRREPPGAPERRQQEARRTVLRSERRRRLRKIVLTGAVLAALLTAVLVYSRLAWRSREAAGRMDQAPGNSAQAPGAAPAFTIADPFAGTPAQGFGNGAAAIRVPRARAVTGYSAAQVAAAYRTVKRLLVTQNLDPRTLRGGRPEAFARLLVPQQRRFFLRRLGNTGLARAGYERSTRTWVTSFAPRSTAFVGDVIKVHGRMSASAATNSGRPVLRVHADYLFVYPVERPGLPWTRMRIVARQFLNVDFARWDDPSGPLEPWLQTILGSPAGARCDTNDGFVHPEFPSSRPDRVRPSGAPIDPYDQHAAPPHHGGCGATTGT